MTERVFSVSELNSLVKALMNEAFPYGVYVRGEIRDYKLHTPSGHRYFILRDNIAQIRCVMWRSDGLRLKFEPKDGDEVKVFGDVSIYERDGQYQLYVKEMEKVGLGSRAEEFERLKKKLRDEGLFAPEHKKKIPVFPDRIGVITSLTGAAIRDIVHIVKRRAPWIEIVVYPCLVQGEGAVESMIKAIQDMNRYKKVDLIILGRGGGSEEELWVFNDERLAREIFKSDIPIVSAVGHEIDFTISDFVADLRAPTPSAAAEITTPLKDEIKRRVDNLVRHARNSLISKYSLYAQRFRAISERAVIRRPYEMFVPYENKVTGLIDLVNDRIKTILRAKKSELDIIYTKVSSISPEKILSLGYSIVVDKEKQKIINSVDEVEIGKLLSIIFRDGKTECKALSSKREEIFKG